MKIYTKSGDKGTTSLLGGTRVTKDHQKLEAYGTVDELNSIIGVLIASQNTFDEFLTNIQHHLFNIGSLLAMEKEVNFELPSIEESDIVALEKEIDKLNEDLPTLKNFILPGGNLSSANAQFARTVCRRAERRVVALADDNYNILVRYLNRLSDYLFVLGRALLHLDGKKEVIWEKR
jgi:cob(I)alamin adenosyltransferase